MSRVQQAMIVLLVFIIGIILFTAMALQDRAVVNPF
jgi:hypothetical protein